MVRRSPAISYPGLQAESNRRTCEVSKSLHASDHAPERFRESNENLPSNLRCP